MKTLTIKRSKWLTGDIVNEYGDSISSLLSSSHLAKGKMCCLGFLARAVGATARQIKDLGGPTDAPKVKWPKAFRPSSDGDSDTTCQAMEINDDKEMSNEDRELKLQGLFARDANIRLLFVD